MTTHFMTKLMPGSSSSVPHRFAIRLAIRLVLGLATLTVAGTLPGPPAACHGADADFPEIFNTEAAGQHPPAPAEMVSLIELPDGFHATLFAGEPDVQQPICLDFDDRGRLLVAENYSYSGGPYETRLRDRIVILEDRNGDGVHDSRKVFWEQGFMLTSLTWGFGGLWILHDGTLSFIPDRNGDDVPDSDPVVMLDGWSKDCGHNFVSGLIWGPDGWLYGRHGIVDTSYPGVPGTPQEERPFMNCGIWRFHPTRHQIEVVCHGTTNPWGLDYNQDGQFFMTNNVQGHLWHVIPGARFQRMYGQDFNPHAYELMPMTADHYHWDTTAKWTDSRDGKANDLGGGHSHVGGLIYHGTNFPDSYHGRIFMCNTHGRRINVNRLDPRGSGYVGRSEPDFMLVKSPWFRGVDLRMGPEGGIYVADWSDNGECHDHDGIHRTSGRIYRIVYGSPKPVDLAELHTPAALQRNDWFGRHARRIQQEQTAAGNAASQQAHALPRDVSLPDLLLSERIDSNTQEHVARALTGSEPLALAQAIRMAAADEVSRSRHLAALQSVAGCPQPANVILALTGALQRFESADRWRLTIALLGCPANSRTIAAEDNLTLMTWYGIEPVVVGHDLLELLAGIPKLQQFACRRVAQEITADPTGAEAALRFISTRAAATSDPAQVTAAVPLLTAFRAGLAGRARVPAPSGWQDIEQQLRRTQNADVILAVDSLSVLFGDGAALADLRALAGNVLLDPVARDQAIISLAQARDAEAVPLFYSLLYDRAVYHTVISALAAFDHPSTARELLSRISGFKDGNRSLAIDTISSRESWALELVGAIEQGRYDARELSAAQVRQLLAFGNDKIRSVLESRWGVVQETPESRRAAIEKWKTSLTPETLAQTSLEQGAVLFAKSCGTCHRLYGEGKTIAPDLTGANRSNLDYLLLNIVDPGAVVPKQFTTSVVALRGGRVITGVIVSETQQSLVIQTDKEQLTVSRDDVEESRNTGKSLMPDGLLDALTPEQVRDLFGFMMPRR